MSDEVFDLTYRTIGNPPQRVFLNGEKIGRVEFRGDGWNALNREDELMGFATSKSGAGLVISAGYRNERKTARE